MSQVSLSSQQFTSLLRGIVKCYSDSELVTLSFSLGIDYDNLPLSGKENKARELILFLDRRGRIGELIDKLIEERPHYSWPNKIANLQAVDDVNETSLNSTKLGEQHSGSVGLSAIAGLTVLLLGLGIGLGFLVIQQFNIGQLPTSLPTEQATSVPQPISVMTSITRLLNTPTVIATLVEPEKNQVEATPSVTAQLGPMISSIPDYFVNFDKGTSQGWDIGPQKVNSQTVNRFVDKNEYRITLSAAQANNVIWIIRPPYQSDLMTRNVHNFVLEVDMKVITGPTSNETMGIYFRSTITNFHAFYVNPATGVVDFYQILPKPSETKYFVKGLVADSVTRNDFVHFRIEAIDSKVKIEINGEQVFPEKTIEGSIGDITLGLWVPPDTSATFAIDNFKLWKLD